MIRIALGIIVVTLVVGIGYALFVHDNGEIPLAELRETLPPPREVSFTRSYEEGSVVIEGTVSTVDVCERATAEASLTAAGAILITMNIPPTEGPCLARTATTAFSVSLVAPEDAAVEMLVNGIPPVLLP